MAQLTFEAALRAHVASPLARGGPLPALVSSSVRSAQRRLADALLPARLDYGAISPRDLEGA